MYFRPECRGLGLGRTLLLRLLEEMRRCGYRRCYLETLESMTAARKLYVECGFTPRCSPLGATGHFACDAWYERAL
jgi:putative acetyltransferase